MDDKVIKQVSVFVENKPGRLAAVTEKLYQEEINIRAFTIAEAGDFGIIRMVVDKTEDAYKALKNDGFTVSLTDVIGVEVKHSPGELYKIANTLGEKEINVEYVYAFISGEGTATIILRVDDIQKAVDVLAKEWVVLDR